jgi:predicted amidohydrolase
VKRSGVTVAVAQLGVDLDDPAGNARRVVTCLEEAASAGAEFVVFPECGLTGYVFDDRDEASRVALDREGAELAVVREACHRLGVHAVVGYLERDGDSVYNTAALFGPDGPVGYYRKRHLPPLGADRFIDASEDVEVAVFETAVGRIGIAICYEIRFPEVMRTLALAGAEIIVLPTNWPVQSTMLADHFTRVRAAENLVYLLVANRGDAERGTDFLGNSQIVDPLGQVLAKADRGEALLFADVDLSRARDKTIRFPTSDLELSPWRDRRPAGYRV